MSEDNGPSFADKFRTQLDFYRIKAGTEANRITHDARYKIAVPSEKREQNSLMAEAFAGEVLHFLSEDMTTKLSPIRPSRTQLSLFRHLVHATDTNELLLEQTSGRIGSDNRPYVAKYYRARSYDNTTEDWYLRRESGIDANIIFRYGIQDEFPHGFGMFGDVGFQYGKGIDVVSFPTKPESPQEVKTHLGYDNPSPDGFTSEVGLYADGERIVINREGSYQGDRLNITDQYYLVGAFDGEGTGRTYWLYGHNDEHHHATTVTPKQTFTQRAISTIGGHQ